MTKSAVAAAHLTVRRHTLTIVLDPPDNTHMIIDRIPRFDGASSSSRNDDMERGHAHIQDAVPAAATCARGCAPKASVGGGPVVSALYFLRSFVLGLTLLLRCPSLVH